MTPTPPITIRRTQPDGTRITIELPVLLATPVRDGQITPTVVIIPRRPDRPRKVTQ